MTKTLTHEEKRSQIVKRIEAKRTVVERLTTKPKNLKSQVEVYRASIEEYKRKIEVLEERIEKFEASGAESQSLSEVRSEELDWMENVLIRFDKANDELTDIGGKIYAIVASDTWNPGDDIALAGAYRKSPEYLALKGRQELLSAVVDNALDDIQKIYNSRGEVSDYNAKELGTELPV